jgi:spore germination cell wall hydrolase CwlJ-like protein
MKLDRSHLSLPWLLMMASCVPPLAAGQGRVEARASARASASADTAPGARVAAPAPLPPADALDPGRAAAPFEMAQGTDIAASLQCLTAAVYYEARSEGVEGQRAVAQVVLNRVRHPAFPKSVCGVVYQGSSRSTGCQFSFTCDGSTRRARDPEAWLRARRVAGSALAGAVYGPVGLATHYHTNAVSPWWAPSLRRAVTVGSHIFYRWRGEWGDRLAFHRPYRGDPSPAPKQAAGRPAEPAPGRSFGIAVHRGVAPRSEEPAQESFGVRVHRGVRPPAAALELAQAAPPPAAAEIAPADAPAAH